MTGLRPPLELERWIALTRLTFSSPASGVHAVAGDIVDAKTAERAVKEAVDRYGRIDTLVNNAGAFLAKPFVDFTREENRSAS
ncbi:SDR family NAD(P)-dependent oxidoreductase [Rhizobium sp. BK377]|uniref:SDR family NAD(P)-dependent oxidoreductase n=1 Tax=Rhizobium sp. BK377 TaxID=2587058 RepID=UPI00161A03AB